MRGGYTVLKADEENRFLLLVAYSANKMPVRGQDGYVDVASPDTLEKACWRFMDNGAKVGLFHEAGHESPGRVVENYIFRSETPWVIESPDGRSQIVEKGDWVVGIICSRETWALYKSGQIGGASPQGSCGRQPARSEVLARMRIDQNAEIAALKARVNAAEVAALKSRIAVLEAQRNPPRRPYQQIA